MYFWNAGTNEDVSFCLYSHENPLIRNVIVLRAFRLGREMVTFLSSRDRKASWPPAGGDDTAGNYLGLVVLVPIPCGIRLGQKVPFI